MPTRTLLPLTVVFALTSATALGVAISPVIPASSVAPAAGGTCASPAPQPIARPARPELDGCREAPVGPAPAAARSKLIHHLRYDQSFPASRKAVLDALRTSGEASAAELSWLNSQLPSGSYDSGAAVRRAVFPVALAFVVAALQP